MFCLQPNITNKSNTRTIIFRAPSFTCAKLNRLYNMIFQPSPALNLPQLYDLLYIFHLPSILFNKISATTIFIEFSIRWFLIYFSYPDFYCYLYVYNCTHSHTYLSFFQRYLRHTYTYPLIWTSLSYSELMNLLF